MSSLFFAASFGDDLLEQRHRPDIFCSEQVKIHSGDRSLFRPFLSLPFGLSRILLLNKNENSKFSFFK